MEFWKDYEVKNHRVGRACRSRAFQLSSECVLPSPGSISSRQSVFPYILGPFLVGRVCSQRHWVISGRQSVYWHVLGSISGHRVCSAMSLFDFRSAECVLPRPGSKSIHLYFVFKDLFIYSKKFYTYDLVFW